MSSFLFPQSPLSNFIVSLEAAVCGTVELYSVIPRGVSNILSIPFVSVQCVLNVFMLFFHT